MGLLIFHQHVCIYLHLKEGPNLYNEGQKETKELRTNLSDGTQKQTKNSI